MHIYFLNHLCLLQCVSCKWYIPYLYGSMDAMLLGTSTALWGLLPFFGRVPISNKPSARHKCEFIT